MQYILSEDEYRTVLQRNILYSRDIVSISKVQVTQPAGDGGLTSTENVLIDYGNRMKVYISKDVLEMLKKQEL